MKKGKKMNYILGIIGEMGTGYDPVVIDLKMLPYKYEVTENSGGIALVKGFETAECLLEFVEKNYAHSKKNGIPYVDIVKKFLR